MNLKYFTNSLLILIFRSLDLYTTHIATPNDFANQEQNFLVKDFGLSKTPYFASEMVFAFVLITIYLVSIEKTEIFKIKTDSFFSYLRMFFFNKKEKTKWFKCLCSFSLKKTFYLYGTIIPKLYIATSIILALNNYWVYLFVKGVKPVVSSYRYFDKIYVIDFIIFYLPIIIFFVFMHYKLKTEYKKSNI
jgi:hypothetical protein